MGGGGGGGGWCYFLEFIEAGSLNFFVMKGVGQDIFLVIN